LRCPQTRYCFKNDRLFLATAKEGTALPHPTVKKMIENNELIPLLSKRGTEQGSHLAFIETVKQRRDGLLI